MCLFRYFFIFKIIVFSCFAYSVTVIVLVIVRLRSHGAGKWIFFGWRHSLPLFVGGGFVGQHLDGCNLCLHFPVCSDELCSRWSSLLLLNCLTTLKS